MELNILALRRLRPDLLKVTGLPSILPQDTQEAEKSQHCNRHPQGCIPPTHVSLDWNVNQKDQNL